MGWVKTEKSDFLNVDFFAEIKLYTISYGDKYIGYQISAIFRDGASQILAFTSCPDDSVTCVLKCISQSYTDLSSYNFRDLLHELDEYKDIEKKYPNQIENGTFNKCWDETTILEEKVWLQRTYEEAEFDL